MSNSNEKVFRKALLDRLSSPEQLNALMRVTNPKSWLALVGCAVILSSAVIWGFIGSIPSKIVGTGILLYQGGLSDVIAVSEGQLSSLEVEPGDVIKEGQVIARVSQPELRQEIARLESRLADLRALEQKESELTTTNATLPGRARSHEVERTRRQLEILQERLETQGRVTSSFAGRVVEVRASVGDRVAPGMPIVSLELGGERAPLEALLYLDSRQGKALKAGMAVELVPSVVKTERYGALLGRVRDTANFPSTRQGMMRVLRNEQLVNAFLQESGESPLAVHVELISTRSTPSGYRWSSGSGPDIVLTSGTRCTAAVTTRTQRPITLVFPSLDYGG